VQMGQADVMPGIEIMLDENGQPYFVYPGEAQLNKPPPPKQEPDVQLGQWYGGF
jgi:hypothetical protein